VFKRRARYNDSIRPGSGVRQGCLRIIPPTSAVAPGFVFGARLLNMSPNETITMTKPSLAGAPAVEVDIPRELGSVHLTEEIGRGAMGVVWLGWDRMLHRNVAVKFLLNATSTLNDPEFACFLEGAQAAASVKHPNLTLTFQADLANGVPYLVMEYIDGRTLGAIIKTHGPLSIGATQAALSAICAGVAALHEAGVIHRDVKPANVLVGLDDRICVTDFGISCRRRIAGLSGHGNELCGTPSYMAPEMFAGVVSPRTDVYALGVTTLELLTGALPLAENLSGLQQKQRQVERQIEALAASGIAADLVGCLQRATHENALFRYKTAREYWRALESAFGAPQDSAMVAAEIRRLLSLAAVNPGSIRPTESGASAPGAYHDALATAAQTKRSQHSHRRDEVEGRLERKSPALSIQPGQLCASVPCVRCGYDLRFASASGLCPECACPVSASTRPDRLIFAHPDWLGRLARGLALIEFLVGAGGGLIAAMLPICGILEATTHDRFLVASFLFIGGVAYIPIFALVFLSGISPLGRSEPGHERQHLSLRGARVGFVIWAISALTLAGMLAWTNNVISEWTFVVLYGACTASAAVALASYVAAVRALRSRVHEELPAPRVPTLVWLALFPSLISVFYFFMGSIANSPLTRRVLVFLALPLLIMCFVVWHGTRRVRMGVRFAQRHHASFGSVFPGSQQERDHRVLEDTTPPIVPGPGGSSR
jgi:serine/threonine protein kinase